MNEYSNNDYRNYIEHSAKGQEWKNHKYLYKTAKGRYVYPEEKSRGQRFRDSIDNWLYKSGRKKKAVLAREAFNSKRWKPLTGVSLNSSTNYSKEQQKINENLDRQDSNFSSVNKKNASKSKTRKSKTDRSYSKASKATKAKNVLASLREKFSKSNTDSVTRSSIRPGRSKKLRKITGTYKFPSKRKSSSSRKFTFTNRQYSPLGRQVANNLIRKRDSNKYIDSVLRNARNASESKSYIDSVLRNAKYGDRPLRVSSGKSSSRKFTVGDHQYSPLGRQVANNLTGKRKTKKIMKETHSSAKRTPRGRASSRRF